jgi:hypothetical protein
MGRFKGAGKASWGAIKTGAETPEGAKHNPPPRARSLGKNQGANRQSEAMGPRFVKHEAPLTPPPKEPKTDPRLLLLAFINKFINMFINMFIYK